MLEASNDECIEAVIRNTSLDYLPCNTTGVLMAADDIEINDWIEQQQTYEDPYNELPTLPTVAIPPEVTPAIIHDNAPILTPAIVTVTEDEDLGSIVIRGVRHSAHVPTSQCLTKVGFDNKSYLDGKYRDGTIHITIDTGHNADHPSSIDPNPLMHALGTAMMHYVNPDARALVFAQVYSFKAGLRMFGEVGSKAAVTELTQLHDYNVCNLFQADSLTPAKGKMALELLMNIVKKCNRQVRTHAIADSSKEQCQPEYKKEDSASPTITMDSIMITATINAHKCWDVTMVDIPGAFLHAYNNKDTFMLLCRHLAKLMVQVDPTLYRKYVIYGKNNKALLYVKLSKAIYGLLKSTLLFYKKFVDDLKNDESPFIINPYDPYIANATIAGLQMTVTDDLKISRVDPYQITKFCQNLASIYGNSLMVH